MYVLIIIGRSKLLVNQPCCKLSLFLQHQQHETIMCNHLHLVYDSLQQSDCNNLTVTPLSCSCHSCCHSHRVASVCGVDHTFQERIPDLPWQQIHSPNVSFIALCCSCLFACRITLALSLPVPYFCCVPACTCHSDVVLHTSFSTEYVCKPILLLAAMHMCTALQVLGKCARC